MTKPWNILVPASQAGSCCCDRQTCLSTLLQHARCPGHTAEGFVHLFPQGHIVRFLLSMPVHILGYRTRPASLARHSSPALARDCTCNSEGTLGKHGAEKAGPSEGGQLKCCNFAIRSLGLWARMAFLWTVAGSICRLSLF